MASTGYGGITVNNDIGHFLENLTVKKITWNKILQMICLTESSYTMDKRKRIDRDLPHRSFFIMRLFPPVVNMGYSVSSQRAKRISSATASALLNSFCGRIV